jgi:hypothetical protein
LDVVPFRSIEFDAASSGFSGPAVAVSTWVDTSVPSTLKSKCTIQTSKRQRYITLFSTPSFIGLPFDFQGIRRMIKDDTIWIFNSLPWKITFFIDKPSVNGPFSMVMLNNQRVKDIFLDKG